MVRNDLAVYVGFAYSPGNELSILGAKVEDQDFFRHNCCEGKEMGEVGVCEVGMILQI